jgi:hypothetical protein
VGATRRLRILLINSLLLYSFHNLFNLPVFIHLHYCQHSHRIKCAAITSFVMQLTCKSFSTMIGVRTVVSTILYVPFNDVPRPVGLSLICREDR